jgi:potassium-transporting ATPase ATP-binding subunit
MQTENMQPDKISHETSAETVEVKQWKTRRKGDLSIWDPKTVRGAIPESFKKLDPRVQLRNPVMFVVEVGSVITTIEFVRVPLPLPGVWPVPTALVKCKKWQHRICAKATWCWSKRGM